MPIRLPAVRRVAFVVLAAAAITVAAGSIPGPIRAADVYASRADSAYVGLIRAFWNPYEGFFYARDDHRPRGGKVRAPFWWTAELWETVMDNYERTGSARDRSMIGAVYNGFASRYPNFASDFNDDRGWWALAATRAYTLTGRSRYLALAQKIADQQWSHWDSTLGGGVWWRQSVRDQKNVATNAPAAMINARLYKLTGQSEYRKRAVALFGWLDSRLRQRGRIDDRIESGNKLIAVDYSYNYGTYVGAALELYRATGNRTYIDKASSAANSAVRRLTVNGILRDEGAGDGGGFKGIFVRNLSALARTRAVSLTNRSSYSRFLAHNAEVASNHRNAKGLSGTSWTTTTSGVVQSLTDMSAVSLFEAAALTH